MPLPPVIFEDDALLVLDKPAGQPVVAEPGARGGEALLAQVRAARGEAVTNAHRPDAESSGLVVFAKTKPALDFTSGQFQAKTAAAVWHALAVVQADGPDSAYWPRDAGRVPATFVMDWWIGRDTERPGVVRAFRRNGGQPAHTDFSVEEDFGAVVWLACRPQTSRRHQVRVHLAAAGLPVLNDPVYGDVNWTLRLSAIKRGYKGGDDKTPRVRHLAMHGSERTLRHPVTKAPLALTAPLPAELTIALRNLRKFARPQRRSRSSS
ncbi:MAG: RluA family pseudouridine synthase [Cephaloticoccus sp.]